MNKEICFPERAASKARVSPLMLERYLLGEVSKKERKFVEAELSSDAELSSRILALEDSDRQLRRELRPWKDPRPAGFGSRAGFQAAGRPGHTVIKRGHSRRFYQAGICAAALLLCVLFPSINYLREKSGANTGFSPEAGGPDRAKGTETALELSLYLDEGRLMTDESRRLPDRTFLQEGNTVQLAYATPPGAVYYGVIFSIDGRAALTLHYPYSTRQSSVLAAGKRTFLSEAYTLDDAPGFETFFMVISEAPLDTESILKTAASLAEEPGTALEKCAAAFGGCQVETITVRKQ